MQIYIFLDNDKNIIAKIKNKHGLDFMLPLQIENKDL